VQATPFKGQLRASNEPSFTAALDAKHHTQDNARTAPAGFHRDEAATIDGARTDATAALHKNLSGMHDARAKGLTHVTTRQQDAKGKDEAERLQVATHIGDLYTRTKAAVEGRLDRLNREVLAAFDAGAGAATAAFEDSVKRRMDAYKADLRRLVRAAQVAQGQAAGHAVGGQRLLQGGQAAVRGGHGPRAGLRDGVGGPKARTMIATGRQQVTAYVESLP